MSLKFKFIMACAVITLKFVSAFQIVHIEHSISGPELISRMTPMLQSPLVIKAMVPISKRSHRIFARERSIDPRKNIRRLFKLRRKMLKNQLWRLRKRHSMIHKALWSFKHRSRIGHIFPQSRFFRSFSLFRNKHPMFAFGSIAKKMKRQFKHFVRRFNLFGSHRHHKRHHRRHRWHRRHHRKFRLGHFSGVFDHPIHRFLRKMNRIDKLFSDDIGKDSLQIFANHQPSRDAKPFPNLDQIYPELQQFAKHQNNKLRIDEKIEPESLEEKNPVDPQDSEESTIKTFNHDIELSVQPVKNFVNPEGMQSNIRPEIMVIADEGKNESSGQNFLSFEEEAPIKLHEGRRLAASLKKNTTSRKTKKILNAKKKLATKAVAKKKAHAKKQAKRKRKAHAVKKAKKAKHARMLIQTDKSQGSKQTSRELLKKSLSVKSAKKNKKTAVKAKKIKKAKKALKAKKVQKASKAKKAKKASKAKKAKHNNNARKVVAKAIHDKGVVQKFSAKSFSSRHLDAENKPKASNDNTKKTNSSKTTEIQPGQNMAVFTHSPKANVERSLRATDEDYYQNGDSRNYQSFDVQDYQKKLKNYKKPTSNRHRRLSNLAAAQPVMQQNFTTSQSAQNMAQAAIQQSAQSSLARKLPPSVMQVDNSIFSEEDQAKQFVLNLEKDMRQTRNAIDNIEDKLVTMKKNESDIKDMLATLLQTKKKRETKALI